MPNSTSQISTSTSTSSNTSRNATTTRLWVYPPQRLPSLDQSVTNKTEQLSCSLQWTKDSLEDIHEKAAKVSAALVLMQMSPPPLLGLTARPALTSGSSTPTATMTLLSRKEGKEYKQQQIDRNEGEDSGEGQARNTKEEWLIPFNENSSFSLNIH